MTNKRGGHAEITPSDIMGWYHVILWNLRACIAVAALYSPSEGDPTDAIVDDTKTFVSSVELLKMLIHAEQYAEHQSKMIASAKDRIVKAMVIRNDPATKELMLRELNFAFIPEVVGIDVELANELRPDQVVVH